MAVLSHCLVWSPLTLETQEIFVIKSLSELLGCGGGWKKQIDKGFNEEKTRELGLQG